MLDPLVSLYRDASDYGISDNAALQLHYTVRLFSRYLERPALVADFQPATVNAWLQWLQAGRAPSTLKSQRRNLLTLWRWFYDAELTEVPPLRVRRLRPVHLVPTAWTLDELRQLLRTVAPLPWWNSLVRVGYDTALRLGDLLALTWPDLERRALVQHKTGHVVCFALRPSTLEALDQLPRQRGPVWQLAVRRETFYRRFQRLVRQAEIRPGTFRWIRRTAITQIERVSPGQGTPLAGHRSRQTTEQHYIDQAQLHVPQLPPL